MNPCRILERPPRDDDGLPSLFEGVPTSIVSDCMERVHGLEGVHPVDPDGPAMVGHALTIRTRPGDNLALHVALDLIGDGDVLVIDGGWDLSRALLGEIMASYAQVRGAAGVVVAGAVRDVVELRKAGFPVFAAGSIHHGPYKDGPGEIHGPVAIGRMVVNVDDVVVGDGDGVVVVPRYRARQIAEDARRVIAQEEEMKRSVLEGVFDRPWLDGLV